MFRTVYRKLTADQKNRSIVYSSQLIVTNNPAIENGVIHEVKADDPRRAEKINNLKDVSFFKRLAADAGYNVINIVRK